MSTKIKSLIVTVSSIFLILFLTWLFCLNHVTFNQIGVAYNSLNGNITIQKQPGWYVTSPFVRVSHLSLFPIRVTIPSAAKLINSKLVRLNVDKIEEFVRFQGFSWELSSSQENIFLGYAFSAQKFSFLEILEESKLENKE